MSDLKDNPDSFIMTGYMLEKAERRFRKYVWRAIECMDTGVKDAKELGIDITTAELSPLRARLLNSMAAAQDVKNVHHVLAQWAKEAGFKPITDEDFNELGAGGNR